MNPTIYQIGEANIPNWDTYPSQYSQLSAEQQISANKGISEDGLRIEFSRDLTTETALPADPAITIAIAQHPGIRYGLAQEDKYAFSFMPFSDVLTLQELLDIINDTLRDFAKEIHRQQATGQLISSGCTFAGVFLFQHHGKNYAISMQLGDTRIGAIVKKQKLEYIPLEDIHVFKNPTEKDRILRAILTKNQTLDVSMLMREIQSIAQLCRADMDQIQRIRQVDETSNGRQLILDYLTTKVETLENAAVYSAFNPQHLEQMKEQSMHFADPAQRNVDAIFKLIEGFLTRKNPPPQVAIDYLNAICSCLHDNLSYISDCFWQLAPTRTFGNFKMHAQGGHSYIPSLKIYELPTQPMLLTILSDGITDFNSATDIAATAENYCGPDRHNPLVGFQAEACTANLAYNTYLKNPKYCDNITGTIISLSGAPLSQATFAMVADGHGNSRSSDNHRHVVNYVQETLGSLLEENITAAIRYRQVIAAELAGVNMNNAVLFVHRAASVMEQPITKVVAPPNLLRRSQSFTG